MLPAYESDLHDDESDDDGSDSGPTGTCAFTFCFEESVGRVDNSTGHVRGMGSVVSPPIVVESIGDVVLLVVFVPIGVESKGGRHIEIFWHPNS